RLLDVVGAHALEDVAKQVELLVGVDRSSPGAGAKTDRHLARLGRQQCQGRPGSRTEENQNCFSHHPRAFSTLLAAHHGLGSIGVPSFRNSTYSTDLSGLDAWVAVACKPPPGAPPPLTATGSPVSTNWPTFTDIR